MTKLSIWLKNNLHNNIKNDLDSTLDALLKLSPPFKKSISMIEQKKALKSSIRTFFKNGEENVTKYGSLYTWISSVEKVTSNKKRLKIIDKKPGNTKEDQENEKEGDNDDEREGDDDEEKEVDDEEKGDRSDQRNETKGQEDIVLFSQRFSFSPSEQGAYVELILEHVELSLFRFIIKQEKYIPHEAVEARHHNAHGITTLKGRWSDENLQRLSTLALEVTVCLGDQDTLKLLREIKQKLESELMERWISTRKRRHEEDDNECNVKKRDLKNMEYGELTDFALNVVSKLEKNEEQVGKIVRLAIAKDEALINIWKSLMTQKDEYAKIIKFVTLANFQFDMVSTPDIIFRCLFMTNFGISYSQHLKIKEAMTQ
ncbi:16282_t:CDS:2 [Acaulospora morrowiae]|uniref:16282_t:CDS:1 n=1 Tax=Acaulospora morrowiae TaxID=94023 RepID=A0A9N9CG02_9GLOM|nr:16282_t:CDS:2 [Acaulospora morrowiae]